jgi:hypothetical protein
MSEKSEQTLESNTNAIPTVNVIARQIIGELKGVTWLHVIGADGTCLILLRFCKG